MEELIPMENQVNNQEPAKKDKKSFKQWIKEKELVKKAKKASGYIAAAAGGAVVALLATGKKATPVEVNHYYYPDKDTAEEAFESAASEPDSEVVESSEIF